MPELATNHLRHGLARYLCPEQQARLASTRVGIAGAGGLGSNVASLLVRSGIEKILAIDHDLVEPSNLNRQQFWPRHLGLPKVEALSQSLCELNPHLDFQGRVCALTEENLEAFLDECPIWVEALDEAAMKSLFVDKAVARAEFVVCASGLCGIGGAPLQKKRMGNLTIVGDFKTDLAKAPPFAPRVTQAAAMMADAVLEYILQGG